MIDFQHVKITEPLIREVAKKIVYAIDENGGRLENYFIPISEWNDFENAYKRQFGALFSLPYSGHNLVLMGIPVCPQ